MAEKGVEEQVLAMERLRSAEDHTPDYAVQEALPTPD